MSQLVLMLSTTHDAKLVDSGKQTRMTQAPVMKPQSVIDYYTNMGLVDKADMIMSFNDSARRERRNTTGRRRSQAPASLRLSSRHYPEAVPSTEKKDKPRRACHVCKWTTVREKRRKDTTWMCRECDVPLCLPDCFRNFHTKLNF